MSLLEKLTRKINQTPLPEEDICRIKDELVLFSVIAVADGQVKKVEDQLVYESIKEEVSLTSEYKMLKQFYTEKKEILIHLYTNDQNGFYLKVEEFITKIDVNLIEENIEAMETIARSDFDFCEKEEKIILFLRFYCLEKKKEAS